MNTRFLAASLAVAALMGLGASREAGAQSAYNYPICGVYQDRSGATSCYFANYAQCAATVGHQGFCRQNPAYVGPASVASAYGQAPRRAYRVKRPVRRYR